MNILWTCQTIELVKQTSQIKCLLFMVACWRRPLNFDSWFTWYSVKYKGKPGSKVEKMWYHTPQGPGMRTSLISKRSLAQISHIVRRSSVAIFVETLWICSTKIAGKFFDVFNAPVSDGATHWFSQRHLWLLKAS